MHTFETVNTIFHHHGDMSGLVTIFDKKTAKSLDVSSRDLFELVARYIRGKRIAGLERSTAEDILGVPLPTNLLITK